MGHKLTATAGFVALPGWYIPYIAKMLRIIMTNAVDEGVHPQHCHEEISRIVAYWHQSSCGVQRFYRPTASFDVSEFTDLSLTARLSELRSLRIDGTYRRK